MFRLARKKKAPSITTSSMSDIGFLLLIFIMLISLMNQRYEAKIQYSEAETVEKTQLEKNFEIWIQSSGETSVGEHGKGVPVTESELEQKIAAVITENPGTRIHIIADRNTPYRYVNSVVQILQLLQYRTVSFVVREKT
ncbi:MAG: biopolymer transporter ExbD [Treponema sp.]|nr:biopolymer transporter ExbD [Treponema sp.]